jgi:hypothetical protein
MANYEILYPTYPDGCQINLRMVKCSRSKRGQSSFSNYFNVIMKIYCLCCRFDEGESRPAGLIFTLYSERNLMDVITSHKKYSLLIIKIAQLVVRQMQHTAFPEKTRARGVLLSLWCYDTFPLSRHDPLRVVLIPS